MPVMLIRVIRDCNVRSDFYDVNRVLFKDGRVLSRFLITENNVLFKVISRIFLPSVNHTRSLSKQEILKTSIGEDKLHQKPLPYCIESSLSVPTL